MSDLLEIFRALADPTRLRMMHLLRTMELSVGELAQAVAQSQPRVSRHVKILAQAGLIDRRKEGNWVFLRIASNQAGDNISDMFDAIPPSETGQLWLEADMARLKAVRADRRRAAEDYFAEHAEDWDAIRTLYAPEAQVEQAMTELLGNDQLDHLLDMGTGTGRILELFGARAKQATAIDRSPDMLRLARAKLPEEASGRFNLMLGDFCDVPLPNGSVDLVTAHQILHYSPTPERVIEEGGRLLAKDGRLLVVDFAPHDREELRARDQHERLGFSDQQIASWFEQAGLALDKTLSLPGGELTVKLWLGRRKASNITPFKELQSHERR